MALILLVSMRISFVIALRKSYMVLGKKDMTELCENGLEKKKSLKGPFCMFLSNVPDR